MDNFGKLTARLIAEVNEDQYPPSEMFDDALGGLREFESKMPEIKTIEALISLAGRDKKALLKYPTHADEYGEFLAAVTLNSLRKVYGNSPRWPHELAEPKTREDKQNYKMFLGLMNQASDKLGVDPAASFGEGYALPILNLNVNDVVDWEDPESAGVYFKELMRLKNMGYNWYKVPYASPLHNWWAFD